MIKKQKLIEENEKLKRKLFIWENIGIGKDSSVKEKEIATKAFLENNQNYTFYDVCSTIGLNKGTYFNFIKYGVEKPWYILNEEMLVKEIKIIFDESNQLYGIHKIAAALKNKGITASIKKVSMIMNKYNMLKRSSAKRPKIENVTIKRHSNRNLVKGNFNPERPNMIWVSDFMELKVKQAKFYLCVILDLFSRRVVGWRLSHKLSDNLALNTFKDAYESRNEPQDLIFHSDLGSQFRSNKFKDTLQLLGVKQSFSKERTPVDNAVMESFYSYLRKEETNININHYENSKVIKEYLDRYFTFYNEKRIHTTIGYVTPDQKEKEWHKSNAN